MHYGHRPAGVLLCLALAVAGTAYGSPAAAAAAYSGRVVNSHLRRTAGARAARSRVNLAAGALMRRLEDEVAPELMMSSHLLLGAGYVSGGALDGSSPRCLKNCAAKGPGDPYTGQKPPPRGCNTHYRCGQ